MVIQAYRSHGKTTQFWTRYVYIIHMFDTYQGYKENNIELNISALHVLCPMFFAYDLHQLHTVCSCVHDYIAEFV